MAETLASHVRKDGFSSNPALQEASEWLKKFVLANKDITDTLFSKVDRTTIENKVTKVAQKLEENLNMASAILELCGFDGIQSKHTVKTLIDELVFYSQDNWPFLGIFISSKSRTIVEFNAGVAELPLLGRILGPALRLGRKLTFRNVQEKSSPFYAYLVDEILVECGVPLLFAPHPLKVEVHYIDHQPSFFNLGQGKHDHNNAMLIFENSDLCSASSNLIQCVWMYQGETYWAPSYVYVQESQFELFVKILKFDAVKHFELLGITCKESSSDPQSDRSAEAFNVFQPWKGSPHFKFYIGWDPQVVGMERETPPGVVILPFRTPGEGIKAANNLPNPICASVWTEKLNFSSEVASQLQVETVWVNCHGVLDPLTSFGSGSMSVPLNGPDLFAQLLLVAQGTKPGQEEAASPISPRASLMQEQSQYYVKNEKEARSFVKKPSSLPTHERISLLRPLQKLISSLGSFDGVWPPEYSYRVNDSGRQITSLFRPCETQLINLIHASTKSIATALAIVHYSIFRGASVIFRTPHFKKHLAHYPEVLDLCDKGFLCFVSQIEKDSTCVSLYLSGSDSRPGNGSGVNFSVENSRLLPFVCNIFSRPKHVIVF